MAKQRLTIPVNEQGLPIEITEHEDEPKEDPKIVETGDGEYVIAQQHSYYNSTSFSMGGRIKRG